MKKLKRLKLHSAVVLQEKEMKAVQGGQSALSCDSLLICTPAMCPVGDGKWGYCSTIGGGGCTCHELESMYTPEPGYGYEYGYYPYG